MYQPAAAAVISELLKRSCYKETVLNGEKPHAQLVP